MTQIFILTTNEGSDSQPKRVSLQDVATLLHQAQCPHQHTFTRGSFHLTEGTVWDNIVVVCDDCGAFLDPKTLGDFIQNDLDLS